MIIATGYEEEVEASPWLSDEVPAAREPAVEAAPAPPPNGAPAPPAAEPELYEDELDRPAIERRRRIH
jgi:hypothetical protein